MENLTTNEDLTKGLFKTEDEAQAQAQAQAPAPAPMPIPAPTKTNQDINSEDLLLNDDEMADDILKEICSVDENGYSPCLINVQINKVKNVNENTKMEDIKEEDFEYVDEIDIEYCKVDTYTLDSLSLNLRLIFDSPNDAYLKELNTFLNKYRILQESVEENVDGTFCLPLLTITMIPKKYNNPEYKKDGVHVFGKFSASMPYSYFRTLDDNNINCIFHLLFAMNYVEFTKEEIPDEIFTDVRAELLREVETSSNGQLF